MSAKLWNVGLTESELEQFLKHLFVHAAARIPRAAITKPPASGNHACNRSPHTTCSFAAAPGTRDDRLAVAAGHGLRRWRLIKALGRQLRPRVLAREQPRGDRGAAHRAVEHALGQVNQQHGQLPLRPGPLDGRHALRAVGLDAQRQVRFGLPFGSPSTHFLLTSCSAFCSHLAHLWGDSAHWNTNPKHRTVTELKASRAAKMRPDRTFVSGQANHSRTNQAPECLGYLLTDCGVMTGRRRRRRGIQHRLHAREQVRRRWQRRP